MAVQFKGGKAVAKKKYKLGDRWSSDFDYDGMIAMFRRAMAGQMSLNDMELLSSSMEDVNYHTENRQLKEKMSGVVAKAGGANKVEAGKNLTYSVQALGIIDGQLAGIQQYLDRLGNDAGVKAIDVRVVALRKEVSAIEAALNKLGVTLLK